MFSRVFKVVAAQLVALSMVSLCVPANALANYQASCPTSGEVYQDDYQQDPSPVRYRSGGANQWMLGGAIILGAAAGAAAGSAAGGGGGRGPRGDTGPAGPGPFIADVGQTITFASTLTVGVGAGATAAVFVSAPDGTVTAIPFTLGLGLVTPPIIVITDPVFGTYTYGIQLDGGVAVTATALETATASRDGSITTLVSGLAVIGLVGEQSQTSAEYTYGPTIVP